MKKITLFFFLLAANLCVSQTYTTGQVPLTTGYTVQFDIDAGIGLVSMTMIGPEDRWLGVGPGIEAGNRMGDLGDDAIIYSSNGLEDRRMRQNEGQPILDVVSQDWTVNSNTISANVRTLMATRAINTGDPEDFIFPTVAGPLPMLWALGPGLSIAVRHTNRGGVVAGITLSTTEFTSVLSNITISPNPASNNLNIKLPEALSNKELEVEVYDVLGKKIVKENINSIKSFINVSTWNSGLYLVKIASKEDNTSVTKRFMKL